jgi:phage shock protein PspC (stress-responsive transcriptional regulator)
MEKKSTMLQNWIKDLVERRAFGVCQYLGEKMHIAPAEVRKYFIYTSFIGMGSPLILYLITAFWVNIRRYIRKGKNVIWN